MPITKKNDSESQEFWQAARETWEKVQQWPEWKRSIRLTEHSTGFGDCPSNDNSSSEDHNNNQAVDFK